jgi:hypothetical protein
MFSLSEVSAVCAPHRPTTPDTRKSYAEAKNFLLPYYSPPFWMLWCLALLCDIADVFAGMSVHV